MERRRIVRLLQGASRSPTLPLWEFPEGDPRAAILASEGFTPCAEPMPGATWYLIGFTHAEPDLDARTHVNRSLHVRDYAQTLRALTRMVRETEVSRSYLGMEDLAPGRAYVAQQTDDPLWREFVAVLPGIRSGGNQQERFVTMAAEAYGAHATSLDQVLRHGIAVLDATVTIAEQQIAAHIRAVHSEFPGPNFYGMGKLLVPAVSAMLAEEGIPHIAVVPGEGR